jgi:hypothetical protein
MAVAAQGQVPVVTTADEAAIRAVLDARNAAYNRHDAITIDIDLRAGRRPRHRQWSLSETKRQMGSDRDPS